jgi:hypothetical protein
MVGNPDMTAGHRFIVLKDPFLNVIGSSKQDGVPGPHSDESWHAFVVRRTRVNDPVADTLSFATGDGKIGMKLKCDIAERQPKRWAAPNYPAIRPYQYRLRRRCHQLSIRHILEKSTDTLDEG